MSDLGNALIITVLSMDSSTQALDLWISIVTVTLLATSLFNVRQAWPVIRGGNMFLWFAAVP